MTWTKEEVVKSSSYVLDDSYSHHILDSLKEQADGCKLDARIFSPSGSRVLQDLVEFHLHEPQGEGKDDTGSKNGKPKILVKRLEKEPNVGIKGFSDEDHQAALPRREACSDA